MAARGKKTRKNTGRAKSSPAAGNGPPAEKKRGRGRPRELNKPVTWAARTEQGDLDLLDEWAQQHGLSRCQAAAAAIRALVKE